MSSNICIVHRPFPSLDLYRHLHFCCASFLVLKASRKKVQQQRREMSRAPLIMTISVVRTAQRRKIPSLMTCRTRLEWKEETKREERALPVRCGLGPCRRPSRRTWCWQSRACKNCRRCSACAVLPNKEQENTRFSDTTPIRRLRNANGYCTFRPSNDASLNEYTYS